MKNMATIKGFKGLRYTEKAGSLKELCCPPYDIISEKERQELLKTNPHNIIRLELPTSYKDGEGVVGTAAYEEAGKVLDNWLHQGILADDKQENIYVYEFSFTLDGITRSVKGFIPLIKIHEFSENIILPHEETLSKAKTDRFNLMTATGANFSQIYSLFSDEKNDVLAVLESATTSSPISEFTDEADVTHKLWKISDFDVISKIADLMRDKQVFIADGHHRYETALNYMKSVNGGGTSSFVPMFLVSMENPGLAVFPTHRIVRDYKSFNYTDLIAKSGEYFNITENLSKDESLKLSDEAFKTEKNAFVIYYGGKYTLMILKNKMGNDVLSNLDVSVLHSLVLERLLGIDKENMAAQTNLTYIKDLNDAISAVDNGTANCAFLMNATRISEIRDVSLVGGKMPQKSTYFYPKLTTGLVMNRIFK
jgi:uncharacterized protein (DUF1015 family)